MYETLVLSLTSDLDRRLHISKELSSIGLNFHFFDAKTPEDVTEEIKQKYFQHIDIYNYNLNHDNVLATFLSHLSIFRYSKDNKINVLLIEDDLVLVNEFNFDNIDFDEFDIFNLSNELSCCSYFINYKSAQKVLDLFDSITITQAFDWELFKLRDRIKVKNVDSPIFIQDNSFKSNLAPDGY